MAHNTENLEGLILDAFTVPIQLPFVVADIMPELESHLKPESDADVG